MEKWFKWTYVCPMCDALVEYTIKQENIPLDVNMDKFNWRDILIHHELNEDLIRKCQDKVCWKIVSTNQNLSEEFIREFSDKVYWYHILNYQNLNEDLKNEFTQKLFY